MKTYIIFLLVCSFSYQAHTQGVMTTDKPSSRIESIISELEAIDDHCEVPCGIYGDSLRVALLKEHSKTVSKAMTQINKLSAEADMNLNQIVRWVNNKEKHAEEIQEIVSQYFLHQRVKFVKSDLPRNEKAEAEAKYFNQLESLHRVLVYAMKCKQSTDQVNVANLDAAISDFSEFYFHGHKH